MVQLIFKAIFCLIFKLKFLNYQVIINKYDNSSFSVNHLQMVLSLIIFLEFQEFLHLCYYFYKNIKLQT